MTGVQTCALPIFEFEHRLARFEIAAREQAGLLELRQHAIHGGETDIEFLVQEAAVHVFGGQVTHRAMLKNLKDFEARKGRLEPDILEIGWIGHDKGSLEYNAGLS